MKPLYLMALLLASTAGGAYAEASGVPPTVKVVEGANKPMVPAMSNAQAAKLIEDYFNQFTTLTAWFSQHASNDQWTHEGTLTVKKPGQFVWQYQSPHKQRIISTGSAVYYVDDEGGQVTQLPIQGGIAKLLGAQQVNLAKLGFSVNKVAQTPQQAEITIAPSKADNQVKSITLTFDTTGAKPQIAAITMVDGLNAATQVTLSDVKTGVNIDPKVFKFTPPQYQQN